MSFTVPNRPDTDDPDQAEPDKGDFQSLGYRKSGVLTGGAATRTATNTLSVEATTGYLNGEYFSLSTATSINIAAPSSGSNAKFVLILVKKAGGVFSATSIEGDTDNGGESASNARYPNFDSTTNMLLAAVYYAVGDTDIDGNSIVDKRVFVMPQANPTAVSSAPGPTDGAIGEIRIDSSISPEDGQSIVWIKTAATVWSNLGQYSSTASAQGQTGSAGNQGEQGTAGATGQAGATGNTGATGQAGAQGTQGIQGSQGLTGSTGQAGATGNTGATGQAGATGNTGAAGQQGPQGIKGDKGDKGDTGAAGASSDYSFVVSTGFGAPAATVGNGGHLMIYGGNEISTVRTSTAFTINWDGVGKYLPKYAGASHPITGYLYTGHLTPTSHGTYNIGGSSTTRYKHGYFSGTVYCNVLNEESDLSLKEDIGEAPGLDFVTSLKPLSYRFKASPAKRHWGFGAQDVEAVCDDTAGIVHKDEHSMGLSYSEFTAPIVKAIQELTERLEAIENG